MSGVFVFTVMTLAATLLHLELFHFGDEFPLGTQVVTWVWMAVYVAVPLLFVAILWGQLRAPGDDPPRAHLLPQWMRIAVSAQAAVMLVMGAGLFMAPEWFSPWWPWPLTPLTGQAVGAWLVAFGVVAAQVVWENDFNRTRPIWISNMVLCVLQLVALARYPDSIAWSPEGWIYVLFLLGVLVIGVYGALRGLGAPLMKAVSDGAGSRTSDAARGVSPS